MHTKFNIIEPSSHLVVAKSHGVHAVPIFFFFCYNVNLICVCMLDLGVHTRAYLPPLVPSLTCLHSFLLVARTFGAQFLLANSLT